jgi:rubrerythrin
MTVTYPRKFRDQFGAREILAIVVRDREIQNLTLNRYRYSEQRACKDLTEVIERLDGQQRELIRDLSRHIHDEARHANWLTELLYDLGAELNVPPGLSYIDEFERLVHDTGGKPGKEIDLDFYLIESLAAINVTEKRGCLYFSAHIHALKNAPQTPENLKIRECIARILPEEAGHVRWGNRWLAQMARTSPQNAERVEAAKRRYTAIEQAAFETSMDVTLGAELRRAQWLLEISETLPVWERPGYLMEHLPRILPETQMHRLSLVQIAFQRDPVQFMQQFLPAFLGLGRTAKADAPEAPESSYVRKTA